MESLDRMQSMGRLGEVVKHRRTKDGKSLKAFADELGFSESYQSLIEQGKRQPSVAYLRALLKVYPEFHIEVSVYLVSEE
jgi:transcriptional regulator with XRE-family HTH domain